MKEGILTTEEPISLEDDDFAEKRMRICIDCKLHMEEGICNPNLYLNPETNETSYSKLPGYYSGCGCILSNKVTNILANCPLKKW